MISSESALENQHEAQAHYENTGMKPGLFNVRMREQFEAEENRQNGKEDSLPDPRETDQFSDLFDSQSYPDS